MPDGNEAVHPVFAINERFKKRIAAKDYLRRMEGITREYEVSFGHPDMKRAFERFFYFTASNVQVISVVGRTRLPDEVIALVEKQIRDLIDSATAEINEDIDSCGALMQSGGITGVGKPLAPLAISVQVTSPLMRRYLDVLQKCDQFEMMIDTLVIEEVITVDRAEEQKRRAKNLVRKIPRAARKWVTDIRVKMQESLEQQERSKADKLARQRARKANGQGPADDSADLEDDDFLMGEDVAAHQELSPTNAPA